MRIVSFAGSATPGLLRRQVRELQEQAWPSEPAQVGAAHDPALRPLSMLLLDADTVLASLDLLFTDLTHAGQAYAAAGLSTVVTRQEARGRGYGRRLVVAAREALPDLTVDLGLFTCDRTMAPFYESAGWPVLPGAVLVGGTPEDPFPSDQPGFDKVTLGAFFSPRGRAGRVSFREARIELFPGLIDKLW